MKKALPIILIAGALTVLFFISQGTAAKNLKIYFKNLRFGKLTGFRIPDIFASFTLVNGTNSPLQITSIVGEIFVNDQVFSSVQMLSPFSIEGNSSKDIEVKIVTPALTAAGALYKLIKEKQKPEVKVVGKVNSNGILIPFSQAINLI